MTEAEWLVCTDPTPMLEFLRGKASDRKLRLFAVACCRRIWHILIDERCQRAVELAEQSADYPISRHLLDSASAEAWEASEDAIGDSGQSSLAGTGITWVRMADASAAASYASNDYLAEEGVLEVMRAAAAATFDPGGEKSGQASQLRCLFGNPFCPLTADPLWLTSTVIALAQTIYADRAFDRLPILADALEDAGCDNADVLAHCRSEGPHVRGC